MNTNSHSDTVSWDSNKQEQIQVTCPDTAAEGSESNLDISDPPGCGFEIDLLILTHVINQIPFGTSAEPADYRQKLYDGGREHCFHELEFIGGDGNEERARML